MDIHRQVDKIIDAIAAGSRPRNSGPWPKTGKAIIADLEALMADPEIVAAFNGTAILAAADSPLTSRAFGELVGMALSKAPTAAHVLQAEGMTDWFASQIMATAHYRVGDIAGGVKVLDDMAARLLAYHHPGNPAILNRDGSAIAVEGMTRKDYLQLADHAASQRPAGKPGRPKGQRKVKRSGAPPIPLKRARAVRAMKRAGATNKEIAATHYPHLRPDSGAARMQVSRDCERADLAD